MRSCQPSETQACRISWAPFHSSTVQHDPTQASSLEPSEHCSRWCANPTYLCVFAESLFRTSGPDRFSNPNRLFRLDRIYSPKVGCSDPRLLSSLNIAASQNMSKIALSTTYISFLSFQMHWACNTRLTIKMLTIIYPRRKMFIGGLNWETTDRKFSHVLTCPCVFLHIPEAYDIYWMLLFYRISKGIFLAVWRSHWVYCNAWRRVRSISRFRISHFQGCKNRQHSDGQGALSGR